MKWNYGKNKQKSLESFERSINQSHKNLIIKKCGLILSNNFPGLAASPNALMSCDCNKVAVVKTYCPYKWENDGNIEILLKMKDSCIYKTAEDKITINTNHEYYYQVQMQMHMANASVCYFYIWRDRMEDCITLKILPDKDFWVENSQRAMDIHKLVILPELLGKYFSQRQPC